MNPTVNKLNTTSTESIIEISHLQISFDLHEVLKDVSLKLYKGENLVVLGKSGSGKSVLIKCIAGLLEFTSGSITVLGENLFHINSSNLSDLRTKMGFLFQSGALYDSMTVKENLEFPLKRIRKKLTKNERDEKINDVLANVGLPDVQNKMPSELSGGMRKRVSLARTVVVDPLIMLYDEPTTGLDPVTSDEISSLINEVKKKYKTSSIIITHDIECVRATADRIIMLHEGVIYREGNLKDFETSEDPFIKAFFKYNK
jgi:phospholipid/cholesterol/gamma-HCH transport system ATP-binding protein